MQTIYVFEGRQAVKDYTEAIKQLLGGIGLQFSGWILAIILVVYVSRGPISKLWDSILVFLGNSVGGAWSFRRFVPE